jgi:hypothetical protein
MPCHALMVPGFACLRFGVWDEDEMGEAMTCRIIVTRRRL